ncbi:MAG: hypothetical protein FWD90_10755 [Defluviitaleaceae bacterium]|nr:hypothetical protein [Defluviitaleaceae bacterium]
MKKVCAFFLIAFAIIFTGCSNKRNNDTAHTDYEAPPAEVISPAVSPPPFIEDAPLHVPLSECFEPSIPLDAALYYINKMNDILDEDDGAMWGMNLRGPFMFVDPLTLHIVANQPDAQGMLVRRGDLYVGIFPEGQNISASVEEFGGTLWAFMLWTDVHRYGDWAVGVMVHKSRHVWDDAIFGPSENKGVPAADDENENDALKLIWLEMEILLYALAAQDEETRRQAIRDAASVRNERRHRGQHNQSDVEIELIEGTARYTEIVLANPDPAVRFTVLEARVAQTGNRGLATYTIGALMCVLLDELGTDWRSGLRFPHSDLGSLLLDAAGITTVTPFTELCFEKYGYNEIVTRITQREENRAAIAEFALYAFANYPTLTMPCMGAMHDDNINPEFLRIPDLGFIIYGDVNILNLSGRLTVSNVPIRREGNRLFQLTYAIPITNIRFDGNRAFGDNWEFVPNPGFFIEEMPNGNFRVRRS